jgi:hypothetical protein
MAKKACLILGLSSRNVDKKLLVWTLYRSSVCA